MKRHTTAVWSGTVKEGKGYLTSESKALDNMQYSYHSRFENGTGTNPEELLAAAHAGCFTMQLSANLTEAGFTPEVLETKCFIIMEDGVITKSELVVKAKVADIQDDKFQEVAKDAKQNCPVSKAYKALDISLDASLD
ncbi:osmotically inducible protein OsmC [Mariniflexile fucanivorans]|uniref:Osmotically inducible protein OsmC n=1 Tax=Mariniflexile fucanivorans TaxID=264023 RepID=A0A4R1RBI6_9FLAO|nr:OsmC family protein [Mariniflexile fucanivorans]TCL63151.1 osmotically inducible protein OsmC [Mariniflexile fucanivorans]